MTDQEIRIYLDYSGQQAGLTPEEVKPLLKELLSYRAFKFAGWWRVWCPDRKNGGWKALAAFAVKDGAIEYRSRTCTRGCLVLPWNEQPSETAR